MKAQINTSSMVIYTSKIHLIYNLTINTNPTVKHEFSVSYDIFSYNRSAKYTSRQYSYNLEIQGLLHQLNE